jgi:predicted SPOUT superfamily RNA methylase MTH1
MSDVIQQLEEMANSKRSYSDRLRDERANYMKSAGQFVNQTTPNDMFSSNGVPLAPSQVSTTKNNLLDQIAGIAGDYEDRAYANDSQRIDLLKTLASVQGTSVPNSPEGIQQSIASLTKAEREPINNYTSAVARLQQLKNSFESLNAPTNAWGSLVSGVTGPLAKVVGQYGANPDREKLRTDIDTFTDEIRKDIFGSAFTETEKRVAKLPGSGKQEARNQQIINSLYDQKLRQLRIELANLGFSDQHIDMYLQTYGITPNASGQESGSMGSAPANNSMGFDADKLLDEMGI